LGFINISPHTELQRYCALCTLKGSPFIIIIIIIIITITIIVVVVIWSSLIIIRSFVEF